MIIISVCDVVKFADDMPQLLWRYLRIKRQYKTPISNRKKKGIIKFRPFQNKSVFNRSAKIFFESQIAFVKEGELLITELITTRIETFNRSKRIIVMIPSANNSLISFEVKLIRRRFSVARLLSCVNFIAHSPNGLNDFFTTSCFFNLIS